MASSEETRLFWEERLRPLSDISIRKMMGEYVIHFRGRVLGFICHDTLLLEDGQTIRRLLPDAERAPLFPGSKDFVIFPESGNAHQLCLIIEAIYEDLPLPKPRRKKAQHSSGRPSLEEDPITDFLEFHHKEKH